MYNKRSQGLLDFGFKGRKGKEYKVIEIKEDPWVLNVKPKIVMNFPELCAPVHMAPALDFTALSFEEEEVVVPERRFEPGWARLSFRNHQVFMETDYVHPEKTLNELASAAILRMKHRWIKFYTDRGEVPYDYDYEPPEPVEEEWIETSSSEYDSPEYFSD